MKRRLPTKKILVATLGVGAVSYVMACGSSGTNSPGSASTDSGVPGADAPVSSGNLMAPLDAHAPDGNAADAPLDSLVSSGNLMAPLPEAGTDGGVTDGESDAHSD